MIRRPPRSTLLSLHDALPISSGDSFSPRTQVQAPQSSTVATYAPTSVCACIFRSPLKWARKAFMNDFNSAGFCGRSEEHTSELQSRLHLVCRLLLERKRASGV